MTDDQLATVLQLLEASRQLDPSSPQFLAIERAAAHLEKSAKKKRKVARHQAARAADEAALKQTGLSRKREGQPPLPAAPALHRERTCYVCKQPYRELHAWYPWLCRDCGDHTQALRELPLELSGRRALLTGGRVKVGYATSLRLLRAGAEVHLTTRFPRDAARRYEREPDFASWTSRLSVHGLDFRALGHLVEAVQRWAAGPAFDVVINNAAQTVWHPPAVFEALHAGEDPHPPAALALPLLAQDLTHRDLHRVDSWVQRLGEIAPIDMVEAQVVNAIAPFLIVNGLRDNLKRSAFPSRYVVNVSAAEGQFSRPDKAPRHPHTNMAKAGLNMLTRTSAAELREEGIFMVSVDPGWMSSEGAHVPPDFQAPLEAEDCAARVLHPIAAGLAGAPLWGVLLKDFKEVPW